MDLQNICKQVEQVAALAGSYISGEHETFQLSKIESKGKNDFVSYVDKTSEKLIVEKLKAILPQAGFITEEGTETSRGEIYNWIIDPLDGTTNFIHGLYPVAVSIALTENLKPVLGVIFEVGLKECFSAYKYGGAFLNGKPIEVSQKSSIADSLIGTGFPYYDYSRQQKYIDSMAYLMQNSHGLRRLGSAATDLAYIAAGRFDAFYEYSLHAWDVAAGAVIVEQAGGKISDFSGGDNWLFGGEIVASGKSLFNRFLDKISNFMN